MQPDAQTPQARAGAAGPHAGMTGAQAGLTRRSMLRYSQLLVVFGAFSLMAGALVAQQAQQAEARNRGELQLLAADDVAPERRRAAGGCLVLHSTAQQASVAALADIEAMFEQLGVECSYTDVAQDAMPDLAAFDKVVVALSDLTPLGEGMSALMAWVGAAGQLMMYLPPEPNGFLQAFSQQLGIREMGSSWYLVPGLRFTSSLVLGGAGRDFAISDPYESSLVVALDEGCTVHAVSADDREVPLIWEYPNGSGRTVFCNVGITQKATRGIYAQAFGLLGEAFAWPVINGSAFYLDDFPAPVPSGSAEYIARDYGTSVSSFYTDVWWPDLARLARKRGIAFTGLVIEDYGDQVEPPFQNAQDVSRFQYFADELLRLGGELGIHGYNHIPLVTQGSLEDNPGYSAGTYESVYQGYPYWPDGRDMDDALAELHSFMGDTFPQCDVAVYVPPSNIITDPGRQALRRSAFDVRVIASIYFDSSEHVQYTQDFGVAADGIVETPRIISGGQIDDYMRLCALSELNLHFVNSHFMHPDDMLDPDRGAQEGWQSAYDNICAYAEWLFTAAPQIRSLTGSGMGAAVQRWHDLSVRVEQDGQGQAGALVLVVEGLHDSAHILLRSRQPLACDQAQGGTVERLDDGLYLVCATSGRVYIPKEAA